MACLALDNHSVNIHSFYVLSLSAGMRPPSAQMLRSFIQLHVESPSKDPDLCKHVQSFHQVRRTDD